MVIGIALFLMFLFSDNPNQEQDDLLTAEQAKTEGLAQARTAGLVGEPTSAFTKLMDLEEYIEISSKGTGSWAPTRAPSVCNRTSRSGWLHSKATCS